MAKAFEEVCAHSSKGMGQLSQRASRGSSTLLLFTTLWPLWRIGDAPGPLQRCVWPLRTSPGSSRRHFGDVLGALGELWEHFLGAFFERKAVLCNFRLKNVREACFNLTKYTKHDVSNHI